MNPLSDFLARFKNMTPPHGAVKKALVRALKDGAGVDVQPSDISFGNGIAFIRASSVAKNAIRLSRARILEDVFREYPKARETVRDIR